MTKTTAICSICGKRFTSKTWKRHIDLMAHIDPVAKRQIIEEVLKQ